MAKPASSAATARSHVATSWQPAAVASACTLATTGCGMAWMVSIISVHTSNSRRAAARSAPAMSAKLWPAENTGPLAARITPRASLAPTSRKAAVSSSITSSDEGVALLGPVEGDGGDVALVLDEQVLVRHGVSLSAAPPSVNVGHAGGP